MVSYILLCAYAVCATLPPFCFTPYVQCTAIAQPSCMHTLHEVRSVSVTAQVRDFQAVIGKEVRQQCLEKMGGKPDILLACVGGGSNAIGLFHEFVDDADVRLIGRSPSFSNF